MFVAGLPMSAAYPTLLCEIGQRQSAAAFLSFFVGLRSVLPSLNRGTNREEIFDALAKGPMALKVLDELFSPCVAAQNSASCLDHQPEQALSGLGP
jgi:hypothetical protein